MSLAAILNQGCSKFNCRSEVILLTDRKWSALISERWPCTSGFTGGSRTPSSRRGSVKLQVHLENRCSWIFMDALIGPNPSQYVQLSTVGGKNMCGGDKVWRPPWALIGYKWWILVFAAVKSRLIELKAEYRPNLCSASTFNKVNTI